MTERVAGIRVADRTARIRHEDAIFVLAAGSRRPGTQVTTLLGTSCFLWTTVESSGTCTVPELIVRAQESYSSDDPRAISEAVGQWVSALVGAGLLSADDTAGPHESAARADAGPAPVGQTMTMREWGMMAHALAHSVASTRQIPMLSIKGPVLELHALRRRRDVADADVWVRHRDLDRFTRELEALGWEPRYERDDRQARVIPAHSTSFFHPSWPVDIDVHWWFPGLGVDGDTAFSAFWERHGVTDIAGLQVNIPSMVDSAVIQLLHCIRKQGSTLRKAELDDTVQIIAGWPRKDKDRLRSRLVELRSSDPLRVELGEIGIQLPAQWDAEERRRWGVDTQTHLEGSTGAMLYEAWTAPWSAKPKVLWNAIWPRDAELIATDVEHRTSRSHVLASRLRRWGRGLRAAPRALVTVLRTLRQHDSGDYRTDQYR